MWTLSTIASFTVACFGLAHWFYTRMDSLVVRLHGARRLHFEEAPRLHAWVAHLSIAAGIPSPLLYVVRRSQPNAFSLGTHPRTSLIILTSAALDELDEAGLCAMVAHEVAHIAHGHTRRATLVAALVAATMKARAAFTWSGRTPAPPAWSDTAVRGARGGDSARRVLGRLQRLGTPPERDLAADRAAARLLGEALGLVALLAMLKARAPQGVLASISDACTPFTAPTLEGIPGASLDARLHQLRRMAAEEQARRAKAFRRRAVRRGSRFFPSSGAPRRRALTHPPSGRRAARLDDGSVGRHPKPRGAFGHARSPTVVVAHSQQVSPLPAHAMTPGGHSPGAAPTD